MGAPMPGMSLEKVLGAYTAMMKDIATKLMASNASLTRENADLRTRLNDALEEVQTLRRQNETMQTEYQELREAERRRKIR